MSEKRLEDKLVDAAESVKERINQGAANLRAEGHEAAAEASDNLADKAHHKKEELEDRAKAAVHDAKADHAARNAKD
ncbi:hypothetical protein [Deinococcus cellulosilyticus]|uniref:Uncharacterized protein n=1 Tax=Deinococcus cellulosilyticus (strain DSM 18568 / NBRC 106333 / KACC 11606 / 5516J-15) TaxID=1223518 RepID=A0A511N0A9_DEIC1|nr:hypothetical protein [Deinococcus cellulosilyticus]GEM45941.1 hypothetical protein DC3_15760 [Deinococcus cellulosilyticus NBRC 106333 = KACC 11606]